MNKIICVVGATASGKSDLAFLLAEKYGGAIVSADSMQIYKGLDVGTAKPTQAEQAAVPHYMIDVVEANENYSAAQYAENAVKVVDSLCKKNVLPIVAGGTGLYFDALIYDMSFGLSSGDNAIRAKYAEMAQNLGLDALRAELVAVDPAAAEKIGARDEKRMIRALEVFYSTGKPFSAQCDCRKPRYDALYLGIERDRNELYERINRRVDAMFDRGLVQEVESLVERFGKNELFAYQSMQAIGYKEFKDYYFGGATLSEVSDKIKQHTRNYAKRQLTWFRARDINWIVAEKLDSAVALADEFLKR